MRAVLLGISLAWSLVVPAHAQDAKMDEVQRKLQEQREQMDALEKQLETLKASQAKASAERKASREQQKTLLTLEYNDGFKMEHRDPLTGLKRFALQVKGRLQMDAQVRLDGTDRKHGASTINGFKERRVYLEVKGTLYTYWHFIMSMELEKGTVQSNTSTYIENTYFPKAKFRIGNIPTPLTLEGNISNKYIRPIERSMIVDYAYPFYELGFMVHGRVLDDRLSYWFLLANGNEYQRQDRDDLKAGRARVVALPFLQSGNETLERIHLGASFGYGKHDNLLPERNGSDSVKTAPGTQVITYRPDVRIDGMTRFVGAEFGWHVGPFGIWGEYIWTQQELVDRTLLGALELVGRKRIEFWGGHVTMAYFLTGEKMTFGRPNVLRVMEPGQPDSGSGAWELVARYDWLQHSGAEGDLQGFFLNAHEPDKVEQIIAGVNWYPNPMVKVSLQWQHAWWNRALKDADAVIGGTSRPKHQDTLMMRVQLEF